MHVADVDRRVRLSFHTARPTLAHAEDDDRQQTGGDDADDGQKCQGGGQVVATLNELQVPDDDTESASGHLHDKHTNNLYSPYNRSTIVRQTDTRLTVSDSKTTWVSRHQKGKTNRDFHEARDDGVAVCISLTICKSFAPRSRQITKAALHHSISYRLDVLPDAQLTLSKHWRQMAAL